MAIFKINERKNNGIKPRGCGNWFIVGVSFVYFCFVIVFLYFCMDE